MNAPPRSRRVAVRLGQAIAGVAVGLAIAEGAFYLRDGGAFPHLNCYAPDPVLGVRLVPGATERVAFGGSAVTRVRINSAGLRGAELAAPSPEEILVVGDSQVFGLGVDEDQTATAALGEILKRPVVNAGVPTYGPPEYAALLEQILRARKPGTIVYVVNFYNDFFEATRPNVERHAVWDGWAVRKETAPSHVASFPGRRWLYNQSHALYALRRFWYEATSPPADERGYPSEGVAEDLLGRAAFVKSAEVEARADRDRSAALAASRLRFGEESAARAEVAVEEMISRTLLAKAGSTYGGSGVGESGPGITYRAARANPGDIVAPMWGEEGRETFASAELIRQGAELRAKLEAEVKKRAAEDPATFQKIVEAIAARDASKKRVVELRAAPIEVARALSPMGQQIARVKAIADAHGARLVAVGLPMDVMAVPAAWKKYAGSPVDLAPVQALMNDVIETARSLGAMGLDATPVLAAVGEEAFLPHEFHLSPKGHRALGEAIAKVIQAPPPPPLPRGLPLGRSPVPSVVDWDIRETQVRGSDAANCTTKKSREWFSIRCHPRKHADPRTNPVAVRVVQGGGGDAITLARDGEVTLIAPVIEGDELLADFYWGDHTQRLTITWKKGDVVAEAGFGKKEPAAAPPPAPADPPALCACWKEQSRAASCADFLGDASEACATTYAGDCAAMVACAMGDPARPPACAPGFANTGALGRCRKLCAGDGDCGAVPVPTVSAAPDAGAGGDAERGRLARAAMDAAAASVKSCVIHAPTFDDAVDECAADEAAVKTLGDAARALGPKAKGAVGGLAVFAETVQSFADWMAAAHELKRSRGTLRLYQDVADAWNAYRPKEPTAVDPIEEYRLYGHGSKGYIMKPVPKTRGRVVWKTCYDGPCLWENHY
jgi:hypothetical protein